MPRYERSGPRDPLRRNLFGFTAGCLGFRTEVGWAIKLVQYRMLTALHPRSVPAVPSMPRQNEASGRSISRKSYENSLLRNFKANRFPQKLPDGRVSFLDTRNLGAATLDDFHIHFRRFPQKFNTSPQTRWKLAAPSNTRAWRAEQGVGLRLRA